eukprot:3161487-Rhodomonas_salina.1
MRLSKKDTPDFIYPQLHRLYRGIVGTFQAVAGQTSCDPCEEGKYCPEGASAALVCPGGTYA